MCVGKKIVPMNMHTLQVGINMINLYDIKYANLPMSERENPIVLKFFKNNPSRVRYRGKSIPGVYNRAPHHCIKEFATSFTIYPR